jgi:hypothetical protein
MRNKLILKEGEVQRILSLHKNAILKESGQKIINEESTVTVKTPELIFEPRGSWSEDPLKLFKGTKFKKSTKIPNALITTRKVSAQFPSSASARTSISYEDNKAFVVYNCNTKNVYLIGSTNEGAAKYKDLKSNKKAIWKTDGSMKSWDKVCQEPVVRDEVVVKQKGDQKPENEKQKENQNQKDSLVVAGTSGTRYSFDFETIMKAIDDTGKCPRSGTSNQAGTSGTSGVQGTQGTSGVGAPVVIQKPTVTKDDFYQWTMD